MAHHDRLEKLHKKMICFQILHSHSAIINLFNTVHWNVWQISDLVITIFGPLSVKNLKIIFFDIKLLLNGEIYVINDLKDGTEYQYSTLKL